MAPSITGGTPALATFNPDTGAMWLDYADGSVTHIASDVHNRRTAATVLAQLGAVRLSDWGLVALKAPMRQARIEVPA